MHVFQIPVVELGISTVKPKPEINSSQMKLQDVINLKQQSIAGYVYLNNSEVDFQLIRTAQWPNFHILAIMNNKDYKTYDHS